MKKVFLTVIGIALLLVLVVALSSFTFFNRRLSESKELKIVEEAQKQQAAQSVKQEAQTEIGAVENSISVQIVSPDNKSVVTSPYITVRGKTTPKAEVFVNERETTADADGNFSVGLTLDEGENPIIVVANDESGRAGETEVTIVYEAAVEAQ